MFLQNWASSVLHFTRDDPQTTCVRTTWSACSNGRFPSPDLQIEDFRAGPAPWLSLVYTAFGDLLAWVSQEKDGEKSIFFFIWDLRQSWHGLGQMRNREREHWACSLFIKKAQIQACSPSRAVELEKQESGHLSPCYSKCGHWTNSMSITWEVR